MDGLELKALAAVYGHQPDRIHVQRAGGDLPQVALLGKEHELADPVKRPLNGEARPCGARSRIKLRNCQTATARMRSATVSRAVNAASRSVRSKIGCQKLPRRCVSLETIKIGDKARKAACSICG